MKPLPGYNNYTQLEIDFSTPEEIAKEESLWDE